jgi:ribonuclease P protein component
MVSERECRSRGGVKCSVHGATGVELNSVLEQFLTRPKYTYPYRVRLSKAEEFRRVFAQGKRTRDTVFTVLAKPNVLGFARLGMAIGKKCASHAVQRHRIKRLVRESFRVNQRSLPALDIVVMCQSTALKMNNHQILNSLEKHWQRLKV